ncbi:MAG TPA: hypothetical protein VMG30_11225 [Acidobacteriota bacterium]|nr:hypothetical protein [Acidobacteriota bacterium]
MSMQSVSRALALFLLIVSAAGNVFAGDLSFTIKQPFKVGSKNYPAGHYRILADIDSDHINILNLDRKTDDDLKFVTRLSQREGEWGEVVFDEAGNGLSLAEVYIVGMDGFMLEGAQGKHKHLVIREDIK